MRTGLQLQNQQGLALTPQLQHAIRLLQLSSTELCQEIEEQLLSNPMLEESSEDESVSKEAQEIDSEPHDEPTSMSEEDNNPSTLSEIPSEPLEDYLWNDLYPQSASGSEDSPSWESLTPAPISLSEHLVAQLRLLKLSDTEMAIGYALIDAINEEGYLSQPLSEITDFLKKIGHSIEENTVRSVLEHIQTFDPVGVGAENLQSCLLIQIQSLPAHLPALEDAERWVRDYFETLPNKGGKALARATGWTDERMQQAFDLIRQLNPRPASAWTETRDLCIIPDLVVVRRQGNFAVELNTEALPKLKVSDRASYLLNQARDAREQTFIKGRLQEARWFLKSLQSRHQTLLNTARAMMDYQSDFLKYGPLMMKPLVLSEIAKQLGVHESTISRVTTQKYIHTPQGTFELKYFFSSQLKTESGQACSSTAIRAMIEKMVHSEDARFPVSDQQLSDALAHQGVCVARRTVSKYREALGIPSSNQRRQSSR